MPVMHPELGSSVGAAFDRVHEVRHVFSVVELINKVSDWVAWVGCYGPVTNTLHRLKCCHPKRCHSPIVRREFRHRATPALYPKMGYPHFSQGTSLLSAKP